MTNAMTFPELVASFPALRNAPPITSDATEFVAWVCSKGMSHGENVIARFVLGVWNPSTDWVEIATDNRLPYPEHARRFDLFEACGVLDDQNLAVLANWVRAPSFP